MGAPGGPSHRIRLDPNRSLQDAMDGGHTRWHPDVPPIARISEGDVVRIDVRDGGDGQVGPSTTVADFDEYDMDRLHPLTGPFHVEGVEPGDLLEVEILDVEPGDFAWSRVTPGGAGVMRDSVRDRLLVKWRLEDGVARSPDIPGVAIPGAPFVGTIGVAPARDRVARIIARERALTEGGGFALAPSPKNAVPGTPSVREEGLRTLPPREFGGNMDIKDVAAGSRVSFLANVPGALLSIGDLHFAQGDGESFGTAIETSGVVEFTCRVRRRSELAWKPRGPFVETSTGSAARDGRRYLITTGTSLDAADGNAHMDLTLATQNALNEMVAYLIAERGFDEAQAQCIVSVAADLRINEINNPPNPLVSAALPLDIFEGS
jgi:formamidase